MDCTLNCHSFDRLHAILHFIILKIMTFFLIFASFTTFADATFAFADATFAFADETFAFA